MPSIYAHNKFGKLSIENLTESQRKIVEENRDFYDLGLQGSDFYFFEIFNSKKPINRIGNIIHKSSCRESLENFLKTDLDDENRAYIYGYIGHFALDSSAHPHINLWSKNGINHAKLETEFDKILMKEDKVEVKKFNLGNLTPVNENILDKVSKLYKPYTDEKYTKKAIKMMKKLRSLTSANSDLKFKILMKLMKILGIYNKFAGVVVGDDDFREYDDYLLIVKEDFKKGLEIYPKLLSDFDMHILDKNFCEYFNRNFE